MTAVTDPEGREIAAAITNMLVHYGYPEDRVGSWWNDWAYDALDGRTPTQAWLDGDYRKVWETIKGAYAASEDAAKRLAQDSQHAELIERRLAELETRYGS
jgi:hypothetical protein